MRASSRVHRENQLIQSCAANHSTAKSTLPPWPAAERNTRGLPHGVFRKATGQAAAEVPGREAKSRKSTELFCISATPEIVLSTDLVAASTSMLDCLERLDSAASGVQLLELPAEKAIAARMGRKRVGAGDDIVTIMMGSWLGALGNTSVNVAGWCPTNISSNPWMGLIDGACVPMGYFDFGTVKADCQPCIRVNSRAFVDRFCSHV